jgi:tRNA (Thr-GGU) A37 N-methylase
VNVKDGIIEIADVDINDGTPLLDIKPYVPEFDSYPESRAGWLSRSELLQRKADDRFSAGSVRPNTSRD